MTCWSSKTARPHGHANFLKNFVPFFIRRTFIGE